MYTRRTDFENSTGWQPCETAEHMTGVPGGNMKLSRCVRQEISKTIFAKICRLPQQGGIAFRGYDDNIRTNVCQRYICIVLYICNQTNVQVSPTADSLIPIAFPVRVFPIGIVTDDDRFSSDRSWRA